MGPYRGIILPGIVSALALLSSQDPSVAPEVALAASPGGKVAPEVASVASRKQPPNFRGSPNFVRGSSDVYTYDNTGSPNFVEEN